MHSSKKWITQDRFASAILAKTCIHAYAPNNYIIIASYSSVHFVVSIEYEVL